jgi:hypothetical protein
MLLILADFMTEFASGTFLFLLILVVLALLPIILLLTALFSIARGLRRIAVALGGGENDQVPLTASSLEFLALRTRDFAEAHARLAAAEERIAKAHEDSLKAMHQS